MAHEHQVSFVKIDKTQSSTHSITHIGGTLEGGTPWTIKSSDAISGIISGRFVFFIVDEENQKEKLVVGQNPFAGAYLKTERDRHQPIRLLKLQEQKEVEDIY